ncbi:Eukaryotic peptide chain release factor GTP-binding subunit [Grifola frondosa]|uniref:Eukaryotic peptide chain release factor GTP-binding subunit n=1 Tax=Grifola frondosa TaxID=5627 RepID=A0A1C7MLP5_GRIFR|nr:Eukaryotic peptide chain release factor GTP-binding subunit [Grifola frondosa]
MPDHKTCVSIHDLGRRTGRCSGTRHLACKGEFETGFEKDGQTCEHIMLVKTGGGVSKLIVVVYRMDESRFSGTRHDTTKYTIKLRPYTGANLKDCISKAACPWYNDPWLLEFLDKMPMVDRGIHAPLMMPVPEKYKDMGTIVVGKIESEHMRKGDTVLLMLNRDIVEGVAMYNKIEDEVTSAFCVTMCGSVSAA